MDVGEPCVKATYRDGPLVLSLNKEITALHVAISQQCYRNTNAVTTKLSSNRSNLKQQLPDYGKGCVQAANDYFNQKFDHDLKVVSIFEQASFLDPAKIGEVKPTCSDIDDLKAIPCLCRAKS